MSELQIDRNTYHKIKNMSREELNAFLIRYANNITKDSTVDHREMKKELLEIPSTGISVHKEKSKNTTTFRDSNTKKEEDKSL